MNCFTDWLPVKTDLFVVVVYIEVSHVIVVGAMRGCISSDSGKILRKKLNELRDKCTRNEVDYHDNPERSFSFIPVNKLI